MWGPPELFFHSITNSQFISNKKVKSTCSGRRLYAGTLHLEVYSGQLTKLR